MTNPTSNFGWQMPTPTDLVTDLPADFEVFGQAVDTSMADLKGGTTGQILSKATNADMDFTWITNDVGDITAVNVTAPITGGGSSGAVTIGVDAATTSAAGVVQLSNSTSTTSSVLAATSTAVKAAYDKASTAATTSVAGIVQLSDSTSTTSSVLASTPTATKAAYDLANGAIAKTTLTTAGDIIYRNATVPTRLGIGTAGQVLAVNSGATAPEWVTSAAGGMTLLSTTTLSGTSTSITVASNTYKDLKVYIYGGNNGTDYDLSVRLNSVSTSSYYQSYRGTINTTGVNIAVVRASIYLNAVGSYALKAGNTDNAFNLTIADCNSSQKKIVSHFGGYMASDPGTSQLIYAAADSASGVNSAITNITILASTSMTAGTVQVYGVK